MWFFEIIISSMLYFIDGVLQIYAHKLKITSGSNVLKNDNASQIK